MTWNIACSARIAVALPHSSKVIISIKNDKLIALQSTGLEQPVAQGDTTHSCANNHAKLAFDNGLFVCHEPHVADVGMEVETV
jgi:hypothetical protein